MYLLAPSPGASFQTRGGTFTADANGLIYNVTPGIALLDMIEGGCIVQETNQLANFRNLLDGGDFTTNPFQRGAAITGITGTPTYLADRFFAVGGSSSSISMSSVSTTAIMGFSTALQFGRAAANTNTSPIYLGQVIETADAIRCQGQYVTFSFWALAGANFSAAAGLSVGLHYGTGINQSANALIGSAAGTWTGQAYPALTSAQTNATAGVAGLYGVGTPALQPITTGWVRYSFTAFVPATTTQLAVVLGYTPLGTAGAADYVQFMGLQLEIGQAVSPFEHRDVQVELEIAQRYCWVINEPAAGVIVGTGGAVAAANAQVFYMATPVQLRTAPTVTVVAGTFKVAAGAAAAAATGIAPGATHTPNAISITTTLTQAAGGSASLQGGGGSGTITASADF